MPGYAVRASNGYRHLNGLPPVLFPAQNSTFPQLRAGSKPMDKTVYDPRSNEQEPSDETCVTGKGACGFSRGLLERLSYQAGWPTSISTTPKTSSASACSLSKGFNDLSLDEIGCESQELFNSGGLRNREPQTPWGCCPLSSAYLGKHEH